MASQLFFVNIPHNCSDRELKVWIESRGIQTSSIRIVRDLADGIAPAFAYADLKDYAQLAEAANILNGKRLRNQIITVKPAATDAAA